MKNDSLGFNIPSSNQEDMLNFDKESEFDVQQKNTEIIPNNFDADLNLSNIINYDTNNIKEKNKKNQNILNIDKSFEESLENFSRINIENENIDNINLEESEIQSEINTNGNNEIIGDNKKSKKKRTKEDLNNTPLPVFECLYCTNEKVVFQHFINEILSEKYLLQTSIYDMNDLNKLILNKRLISNNRDEKLLNLVMKNTEYIKIYIPRKDSDLYFKSDLFNNLCIKSETEINRLFKHKIEDSIVRKKKDFYFKGINKIPRNSMNNKCLFNSTNSLINNFNALSGLVEPVQTNNVNNNVKNNYTIGTCSNNSINFNSLSLNNNEFNCYYKDNNNNMLDYIVEKIEKNEESVNYVDDKDLIIDFFKFDLSRKINKKDIKWENKIYNIWNPDISSDFDENDFDDENDYYNINKINNDTKNKSISMNINNLNNKCLPVNRNLSNKSMGFIKYQKSKAKNLIFTFNKKKDKSKNKQKKINNNHQEQSNNIINKSNLINNNISNDNIFNSNSNINIISFNDNNPENITKDISEKNYLNSNITNKSVSINNIIINKSQDTNKKIPKQNKQTNHKNTILNNRKNVLTGISFLKSFSSVTNSYSNMNKSVNILGKSKKKINYSIQNINKKSASKNKNNFNIKSLQYMSSSKSNASTNYSIGISINLKSNSSVKSNGFLQCCNNDNSIGNGLRIFNSNKSNNGIKLNERKKSSKNLIKKNNLFNLFNNLNLVNFKQKYQRAKSNYKMNNTKNEKKIPKSSKSINIYKNKNRKNNYNIYKMNKMNKQKMFNFSSDRQNKAIIPRSTGPLLSSNSKSGNNNDNLYSNSVGLSIGSNDNNMSQTYTHVQFNSISNLNKSNSNINNSKINSNSKNNSRHLFSPNKFNKTFYNNNISNKDIKRRLNDLIFIVNHNRNKNYDIRNKNNISDFKNKSINLINSKSGLKKQGYKSSKRFMFK